ncbi:hypothetical protein [Dyella telluris]|uniref:Uncharacterized protein n=1 Tax=Dyella telluris TaxID=2763498 RepID=A0A7G8Q4E8_9GAMM|nr:hypothetical protein [Dyella telluris]QNK01656.1 hypothetical protein H8F01_00300 [Dyella telluris]
MATVPANPSLQDLVNVFGGPGDLFSYARGGGLVPNISQNYGVSDNSWYLELAQFVGATNYVPFTASATGSTVSFNLGNKTTPTTRVMSTLATAYASGGTGNFSYNWRVIGWGGGASGATAGSNTNQVSAQCTALLNGGSYVDVACDISDGVSSQTVTARCSMNYFNTV